MASPPKIVEADLNRNTVLVTFADGKVVIYSASVLYKMLPLAEDLTDLVKAEAPE